MLFIYGLFEDHEEIEFFCMEILTEIPSIKALRYVIENDSSNNIIVIFDSESEHSVIAQDLVSVMVLDTIKFYFLFPMDKIVTAHLPEKLKDFIFKPVTENMSVKIEYLKQPVRFDLDEVLEKIEKLGLDSLSEDEKNFLDGFK
jgi:hypothetical protein